jgi:hypothetical protein
MKDILNIIKTILIYIFLPFRVIFLFLLLLFSNVVIHYIKDDSSISSVFLIFGKIIMFTLSLTIDISNEDYIKYMTYLYSDKKFICVFNHTTMVDGFVLASAFPRSCFVVLKTILFTILGYTDKNNDKCGSLLYVEKGKTSKKIKDSIDNRKSGEPVLFIAPGSGNIPKIPGNITEFNSKGAFIEKCAIMPIVMKYEDNSLDHNSDNGESILHSSLKLFLVNNYKIKIKVCDMIEANDDETIEEYRDRVYNIMNDQYKKM